MIVIIAFVLGHNYGENTLEVIDDIPVPKITIEMPQSDGFSIEAAAPK